MHANNMKLNVSTKSKKDFETDREVRWCPGCGDYAILASVQKVLAEMDKKPEDTVFISGIGCSSRFPYYVNAYGFHTIHGRAPTIATGVKLANPELDVWVVTGDGDGLSIGLGHLMHLMRRNIDVTVLLINNRIYGLTKGQYSPTSDRGQRTKSSPQGVEDHPLCPVQVARSANCGFIGRAIDVDSQNLQTVLKAANQHRGTALVEIYQNCNVFNDGAFNNISQRESRAEQSIQLFPGKPMVFGLKQDKAIVKTATGYDIIQQDEPVGCAATYDPNDPVLLELLLQHKSFPVPLGVISRQDSQSVENGTYQPVDLNECQQELEKQSWLIGECST